MDTRTYSQADRAGLRSFLRKILCLLLALSMVMPWTLTAQAAEIADVQTESQPEHTEHTPECGYRAAAEGSPCKYDNLCDQKCKDTDSDGQIDHARSCGYTLALEKDLCDKKCRDTDGDGYADHAQDCAFTLAKGKHTHGASCGYREADAGVPCALQSDGKGTGMEGETTVPETTAEDAASETTSKDAVPETTSETTVPETTAESTAPEETQSAVQQLQALIDALPEHVTEDNRTAVTEQLQVILPLYAALTEAEQEQVDITPCVLLQGELDDANVPQTLAGETPVTESDTAWSTGTYIVNRSVTLTNRVEVTGDVTLILEAGCRLTASQGIQVSQNNSFTIQGDGELEATTDDGYGAAGIGGNISTPNSGTITINGGIVTAQSGNDGGAGIGGGSGSDSGRYSSGAVIINGGTVNAIGKYNAAGIGGGYRGSGTVTINGGTVTAKSSNIGAGIGGGMSSGGSTVTITGGKVTATCDSSKGAGIGGDSSSGGGTFSTGGSGKAWIEASSISDNADTSTWSGIIFQGNNGGVYGNQTLNTATEIPGGKTLTVAKGAALTVGATLTNSGTLTVAPGGSLTLTGSGTLAGGGAFKTQSLTEAMISVPGDIVYNGSDQSETIKGKLTLSSAPVAICGKDFQFDGTGWTPSVAKDAGSELEYAVTYTYNGDAATTVTKAVRLKQSGTEFVDAGESTIKTYGVDTSGNPGAEAGEFVYGETFCVKAKPIPTGLAPVTMTAASRLRGGGEMTLCLGDTPVSAPASMGADGSYTMTVSVKNLVDNGAKCGQETTLTVKFSGTDSMAAAEGTVNVTLKPATISVSGAVLDAKTYDGSTGGTVESVTFDGVLSGESLTVGADYTAAAEFADANAGTDKTATVTVTLPNDSNYVFANGAKTATYDLTGQTIQKKTITPAVKLSPDSYVWDNGKEIKPPVTVTYTEGDQTVTVPAAEYTAEYRDNTDMGTASVTVTGSKNYSFTATANFTITCPHPDMGDNGNCTVCREAIAATVEADGNTAYYTDISSAWKSAVGRNATVTMLIDQTITEELRMDSGNVTLKMAGGVKLNENGSFHLIIIEGGHLTLESCTLELLPAIHSTFDCLQVRSGVVDIYDCSITCQSSGYAVDAFSQSTVNIHSGTFTGKDRDPGDSYNFAGGLGCFSAAVTLYGGTFTGASAGKAITTNSSNKPLSSILADGYAYRKADGTWVQGDTLNASEITGTVTVLPIPVKISQQPTTATVTYGAVSETLTVTAAATAADKTVSYQWYYENGTPVTGQTASSLTVPANLNVGDYKFYCSVTCDGYTVNSEPGTVTVKPKTLTPSVTGTAEKSYDGTTTVSSALSIHLDGVVNHDNVTATAASYAYDTADAGENKTVTATGITLSGAAAGNYTLSSDQATVTGKITKSQPTIAFASGYAPGKTYDGKPIANPTLDNLVITGAKLEDVQFTWTKDGKNAEPVNAGTYTLTAAIPETDNTAPVSAVLENIVISPISITVTADSLTKTYGDPDPELTCKVTAGDALAEFPPKITLERKAGEEAGEYSITAPNAAADNPNYKITVVDGKLTIGKRDITDAEVILGPAPIANGREQTQKIESVTVKNSQGKALEVTCAVTGNTGTDAGKYEMIITGTENFTGEIRQAFAIAPAATGSGGQMPGGGTITEEVSQDKDAPAVSLGISKAKLLELLIQGGSVTPQELVQVADGTDLKIIITVKDSASVSTVDQNRIKALAKGCTVGSWLDISLYKQLGDGKSEPVHETGKPITLTVQVPERLLSTKKSETRTFRIVRCHDGKAEFLEAKVDDGKLTFETDRFSSYAIVYSVKKLADKTSPHTGDSFRLGLWVTVMLVSAAGVGALVIVNRKKKK